jgi:hypothetical protein
MTDIGINPSADIEISHEYEPITVRISLAGPVTQQWRRHYQAMARAVDLPARIEEAPGHAWIVVTVPTTTAATEVPKMLDNARALIAEAAAAQTPTSTQTEAAVREWWAHQQA